MAQSRSVLIVDDDPAVLEALSVALVPSYQVVKARTGSGALEIVSQQAPDLILLDYFLPDVSGLTILHALHRAYPMLPVILMTGFGSEDLAVEGFRGGIRDYLKKPIDLRDLTERVETMLRTPRHRDEAQFRIGSREDPLRLTEDGGSREIGLQRAVAFIDANLHTTLKLDHVAREAGMSKYHFCRYFKSVTHLTFREFLASRRIARAMEFLRDRQRSLSEVYWDVGFKSPSHFSRVFRKLTGQTPSRYRRAVKRVAREVPFGEDAGWETNDAAGKKQEESRK